MKIKNHWLTAENATEKIIKLATPNVRDEIDPDYLIIHYTAGDTARSAINWFMNTRDNADKLAAHIVIDLDGTVTQLVPFNRRANHAGSSTWNGTDNLNFHSIGIEMVNPGYCEKLENGFSRKITATKTHSYPLTRSADILKTNHKHRFWTAKDNNYWFKFPEKQVEMLYKLSKVIINEYQLVTALGHDDISPLRKSDPGPCFPWKDFKFNVFNKTDNVGEIFIVNTVGTSFRAGHSTNSTEIKKLNKGYEVGLIETFGEWNKVYLANDKKELLVNNRCIKIIGWIHSSLLNLKNR